MKSSCVWIVAAMLLGCATGPRKSGPAVEVYEADASQPPALRRLPEGCRLLGSSGPVDQMESERAMDDPYKKERLEVAKRGGNVLLVLSQATVTRPNTDCPSGDVSADCLRGGQSWYRVRFEEYACAPDAIAELRRLPPQAPRGGVTLLLSGPKKPANPPLTPPELEAKVLDMMHAHVAADVVLTYVQGQRLSRKMTAEEIIAWTKAGVPDAVIQAAASR